MPRVTLRPTIAADLPHLIGEALPFRIKAFTVLADDRVIGIGGVGFPPGGPPIAFVQQAPGAKKFPVAFHKAGLAAMHMIRDSGLDEVLATADADDDAALRWLDRLGFARAPVQVIEGRILFIWSRDVSEN